MATENGPIVGGVLKNSVYSMIEVAFALWVYTQTDNFAGSIASGAGVEALRSWIKAKFDLAIL